MDCLCLPASFPVHDKGPGDHPVEVGKGVEYCTLQTTLLLLHAPGSQAGSTSALAGSVGAIAAVNGSYFNVKTREPVTYLKTDGRQVAPTTVREAGVDTDGILAISKWGRVSIFPGDTASCNRLCKKYKDACLRPHPAPRRAAGEGQLAGNRLLYKHHPRTKPYTFKQDKGASQSQDDRRDPVQKRPSLPSLVMMTSLESPDSTICLEAV